MSTGPSTMRLAAALALSLVLAGCGQRVLIVKDGQPVQLAEPARARVYVTAPDGTKVKSADPQEIPAGWVAFPPSLLK